MELSLRRWKPGQLLLGWGAYWVGLIGVTMGSAIRATWRATNLPDHHGTINANYNNGTLNYEVIEEGVKTWAGSAQFSTVMLWLVGPPLLLWLAWLIVRKRAAKPAQVASGKIDALPAGSGPAEERLVTRDDRVPVERERIHTPNP